MPSEKAKENKTLSATCAACGKAASTELMHGVKSVVNGRRALIVVCDACFGQGWRPHDDRQS